METDIDFVPIYTHEVGMKEKSQSSWAGISPYADKMEQSGSVQATTENLDEVSNKIREMLPNMKSIKGTGIIKKTESFKESKDILTNFKTALYHISEESYNTNPLQAYGMTKGKEVPIQSVNKNAYEIRSDILKEAVDIVKLLNIHLTTEQFADKVLEVARKLYSFVENKK